MLLELVSQVACKDKCKSLLLPWSPGKQGFPVQGKDRWYTSDQSQAGLSGQGVIIVVTVVTVVAEPLLLQ